MTSEQKQNHQPIAHLEAIQEVQQENRRLVATLQQIGASLVSELDLQKVVQAVTDAATNLTNAEFGAFFYNVINRAGESYTLYTLSGAPLEAFSKYPQPRNTAVFGPTFRGEGTIRIADILKDARYGQNPPYNGMPEGHLPVRSYLAVPVVSRSGEVLGGLFFGHHKPGMFTERDEKIVEGIAGWAGVAVDNARLYKQSLQAQAELEDAVAEKTADLQRAADALHRLAQKVVSVQEVERRRLSVDLHDSVGQLLTALQLKLKMLESQSADGLDQASLQKELSEASEMVNTLYEEIRTISHDLRPPALEQVGLHQTLHSLCREFAVQSEVTIEYEGESVAELPLPDEISISFYRFLQEALTNIARHARATAVSVTLDHRDGTLSLSVTDNGVGFDAVRELSAMNSGGVGLLSLKERMELIGGELIVQSQPGEGTSLLGRCPLPLSFNS